MRFIIEQPSEGCCDCSVCEVSVSGDRAAPGETRRGLRRLCTQTAEGRPESSDRRKERRGIGVLKRYEPEPARRLSKTDDPQPRARSSSTPSFEHISCWSCRQNLFQCFTCAFKIPHHYIVTNSSNEFPMTNDKFAFGSCHNLGAITINWR